VNQNTIVHAHRHRLGEFDDLLHCANEAVVMHNLGKTFANLIACLRPAHALRQPARHV
jgi:hypothetical protein